MQSFNAVPHETQKFHERVKTVLTLARKEAVASGIFFGSTGWSGNVTLLALLGYGWSDFLGLHLGIELNHRLRWHPCDKRRNICWRPDIPTAVHCLRWERFTDVIVRCFGLVLLMSTNDNGFLAGLSS